MGRKNLRALIEQFGEYLPHDTITEQPPPFFTTKATAGAPTMRVRGGTFGSSRTRSVPSREFASLLFLAAKRRAEGMTLAQLRTYFSELAAVQGGPANRIAFRARIAAFRDRVANDAQFRTFIDAVVTWLKDDTT